MKLKSKIYLNKEASGRLSILAGRTGMQPNLLCRIGFCLSLAEIGIPHLSDYLDKAQLKEMAGETEEVDITHSENSDARTTLTKKDKVVAAPKEFNRYTLTGEWETLFLALLRERCAKDGLDLEQVLEEQFAAHLNRGVLLLYDRVKSLTELGRFFRYAPDLTNPELEMQV